MKGWIVLYSFFGGKEVNPQYYKTYKNALKYAEEHRADGRAVGADWDAVIINVEDMLAWAHSGTDELERIFKL